MPRLGGLETLSAIKSDPELQVIPVIMLSASAAPADVRESYLARANSYVQKPTDLDRYLALVQAIEAFWMECALLPTNDQRRPLKGQATESNGKSLPVAPLLRVFGKPIAVHLAEEQNRAMQCHPSENNAGPLMRRSGCAEHNGLLSEFGDAVQELLALHEQQFLAIIDDDSECTRFELLIHMANERKQRAKYAYLRHVEAHGCSNENDLKQART